MSDYFTRLSEQVIGAEETIKPRVPYRFESAENTNPSIPISHDDNEPLTQMQETGPLPQPPAHEPMVHGETDHRAPVADSQGQHNHEVSQAVPSSESTLPTPKATKASNEPRRIPKQPDLASPPPSAKGLEPRQPARTPPPLRANEAVMPEGQTKDARSVTHPDAERPIIRPEVKARKTNIHDPIETSETAVPRPTSRASIAKQSVSEPIEPPSSERSMPDATPILRPRKKHDRDAGATMNLSLPAEPRQEPTIKVTIGRVEVRAIMDAPKPQATRSRKLVTSAIPLDEYLKRHQERRR